MPFPPPQRVNGHQEVGCDIVIPEVVVRLGGTN